MSQLDLKTSFPRLSTLPENLEDQPSPVDDFGIPGALKIALLHRRKSVVDNDQTDRFGIDFNAYLFDLAGAAM